MMRVRQYLVIITAFLSLSAMAHSVTEEDGYYRIEHTWPFEGKQCSISLNISKQLYDYYQNEREHLAYRFQFNGGEIPPNYYSFMLSEHDRPVMRALAEEFSTDVVTKKEQISLALTFVQSLPYAYDSTTKGIDEYLRYPIETLVDGYGDCEDKVALLAALLYEMDADFILLVLPEHMAIGVHCDEVEANRYLLFHEKKYYYLETTMEGWQIGQIPEDYHNAKMEAVPVDDIPTLLLERVWFESLPAQVTEEAECNLQLDLYNVGPGWVTELMLRVRLIEKGISNYLLFEEYLPLRTMQEGEHRTENFSFKSWIMENCVLEVELTGAEVDSQSYTMDINYSRTNGE